MTATPSVTLTAAQARAVLVGIATTDEARRAHAVGVMADALLAAPAAAPTITMTDPTPGRAAADALRVALARPPRDPGEGDVELQRRRAAVVEAAEALVDSYGPEHRIGERGRMLVDAVEALREYTPAEVAAPTDTEPAPAAGPSVRDDLHALAPLPWRTDDGGYVEDRRGRRVLDVDGFPTVAEDERVAALLVRLVNGPEVRDAAATAARAWAERAVIDAARALGAARATSNVQNIAPLLDAVDTLDKAASPGGAA